jgi:tetratricopeptide (TPR) repeat protein
MPRWLKVVIATMLPSGAGALAWWICVTSGLGLDTTGIVVGLVVLLPGTPLAIWAGQHSEPAARSLTAGFASADRLRPAPRLIGDVPREPKAFQRRQGLSERVDEAFSGSEPAAVCVLAGARGVGKTHLAAAYARRCLDRDVPVAWLHAETVEQLHGSLDVMAAGLGLPSDSDDSTAVTRKIRTWLQERREPYLVVFDNAVDPDTLMALLPSHGRARVLITTNDHSFERVGTLIEIERFTAEEAVTYLRDRAGEDDDAGLLAEELDRLPLALSIAAAELLGPPRRSCASYLERLRATPIDVLLARPRGAQYPQGVAQAIMLSVLESSPAAARLLGELSVLSASGVALDMLGPETEKALAELGTRSLVTFSRDSATAIVHRLVRRAVRDQAERDGVLASSIETAALRLRAAVEAITDEDTWRKFPTIMAVADHATALWTTMARFPDSESERIREAAELVLRVRQAVASRLIYLNDGVRAIPIAEAVVTGREKLLGADHPDTLAAMHTLAHAYEYGGRATEATELYQRVAAERARTLGDDHPDTLWSRASVAFAYTMAGRASDAVTLLDQVVDDQQRILDPDHPTLLAARFFQAYTSVEAGRPEQGALLFERLIADHERLFGADYPDTWIVRGRLAWAYRLAGRAEEAVRLYEQVAAAQERLLGADHSDTLITRHGLAAAYEVVGRTAEALTGYERVAARFEAVMGREQTLTKTALSDLERLRREVGIGLS